MIKAIIFDCFGVIITDALKAELDNIEAANPKAAREIVDIIHANNRGIINPAESNQRIADILDVSVRQWRKRIDKGEVKDLRVMGYIKQLRPTYKTALLSNIGRQSLTRRFGNDELKAHFDAIVISGELGIMKPEPEIFLYATKQLQAKPEECIMIDDRQTHCAGAREAGMTAILYKDFMQMKHELEGILHA